MGVSPRVLRGLCGGPRDFPRFFGGSDPVLVTLRNCWESRGIFTVLGPKYRKFTYFTVIYRSVLCVFEDPYSLCKSRVHQRDLGPRNASGFIFWTLKGFFCSILARKSPELVTHKKRIFFCICICYEISILSENCSICYAAPSKLQRTAVSAPATKNEFQYHFPLHLHLLWHA